MLPLLHFCVSAANISIPILNDVLLRRDQENHFCISIAKNCGIFYANYEACD